MSLLPFPIFLSVFNLPSFTSSHLFFFQLSLCSYYFSLLCIYSLLYLFLYFRFIFVSSLNISSLVSLLHHILLSYLSSTIFSILILFLHPHFFFSPSLPFTVFKCHYLVHTISLVRGDMVVANSPHNHISKFVWNGSVVLFFHGFWVQGLSLHTERMRKVTSPLNHSKSYVMYIGARFSTMTRNYKYLKVHKNIQ